MADGVKDVKQNGQLLGQKVAFTGRLAALTRADAIDLVRRCGGEWHRAVGSHTTLVVVGQEGWPLRKDGRLTAKLRKARLVQRRRPLAILSEAEFLARVGANSAPASPQRLSTTQVCDILRISGDRLRGWVRLGLVRPTDSFHGVHYFDFRQVSWAKTLAELIERGVSPERIRRSLRQLRRWVPDTDAALAPLAVVERDRALLVRLSEGRLAEPCGQGLFDFADEPDCSTVKVAPGPQSASEWFEIGCQREQAGQPEEAVAAYRQALLVGGPNAEICFNLANTLYRLGRRSQAVERYYQTVETSPAFTDAWNNLGNVLVELEQYDDAIEAFRRVLELDPHYMDAHYNLADTLDDLGRCQEAAAHWHAYLRHDPTSPWGRYARRRLSEIERSRHG